MWTMPSGFESYGLKVGEVKLDETSDEPYGTVLFQDPAEGDMVATGSFVNLTVSQGDTVVFPADDHSAFAVFD